MPLHQPFPHRLLEDLATRLASGPYVTESIDFVMDRQMLRGVKIRAERTAS